MADISEAQMQAAVARAFGRAPVEEKVLPPATWPGWLPLVHTQEQWVHHQEQVRLWEAQEAERKSSVQESADTAVSGRVEVHEANRVAPVKASSGKLSVTLISSGVGSSGYYSPAVLEAAGRDKVFPAGTHCYVDHPTQREDADRPERSIRDLAAVLTTDARWSPATSSLVAEAQLMPAWQSTLGDPTMAATIGMSIRADGDVEMGEVDGKRQRVITKLVHGTSVDFVTRAGRGGSYSVVESGWNRW